jgi:hypothetical protein
MRQSSGSSRVEPAIDAGADKSAQVVFGFRGGIKTALAGELEIVSSVKSIRPFHVHA